MGWKWDRETRVKAQGMLACLTAPQHIVFFCVAKDVLEVVKVPATKLQKKDQDIYQAYSLIDEVLYRTDSLRENVEEEFKDWFREAEQLAESLDVEIIILRLTGRQRHRANAPSSTLEDYYRKNVAIPFLDHLKEHMHARFSEEIRKANALFSRIPANLLNMKAELRNLAAKLKFWEAHLPMPSSLLSELKKWVAHWERRLSDKDPANLLKCLQQADEDQFPNVKQLLRIGCTLPAGSAEAECSFSAFRRLRTYLRSRMSEERLSGLVLIHIHHSLHFDVKEICHKYIQAHERRLFQGCLIKQTLMEDNSV